MEFNISQVLLNGEPPAVKRLALIEFNMVLMVLAAATLVIFGTSRRRSSSLVLVVVQWTSYTLVTTLVFTYTIGQMLSAQFRNELFSLWAMFFLILVGSVDTYSAFCLEDNEQWRRYYWQVIFLSCSVGGIIGVYLRATKYSWYAIPTIFLFICYKTGERTQALKFATKSSLAKNTKLIADFMGHEHEIPMKGELDPTQMQGYNYLVNGDMEDMVKVTPPLYQKQLDITKDKIVTLQKVWQCRGRLLTGETGRTLKDICLSFALFRLLCRRFGGHPFSESGLDKTWKFIRRGLLSENGDYNRVFRVIEVELCFLFDLFYTKYASTFMGGQGFRKFKLIDAIFVLLGCFMAANVLSDYEPSWNELNLITVNRINIDKVVTGIAIAGIVILEIAQLLFLIVSDWTTVIWICSYVKGNSWLQNDDNYLNVRTKLILYSHEKFKPWERKLGQYSLLASFNHNPRRWKLRCLISDMVDIPRQGQKESPRIDLPEEVKKAVILSLKRDGPKLSNGEESLLRNKVWGELSWACKLETTTHVILTWHVATSLCMMATRPKRFRNEDFIVATSLSSYCAYLVAFAPRLISDNPIVSESIFDEVVKEARDVLGECNSVREKYEAIVKLSEGDTIIHRGAMLVKNLGQLQDEEDFVWKVLADFWAELMLFLAPSGDPIAHAEYLAIGGEFVTHLWTLLSHAGILKKCSPLQEV